MPPKAHKVTGNGVDKKKKDMSVDITFVLDRSGSMGSLASDVIDGFNSFVKQQHNENAGDAVLTTILFDHEYDVLYSGMNMKDVPTLTSKEYNPRGSTALFDAVARGIGEAEFRVQKTRPDKTVFVIFTDGLENASREVISKDELKKIIESHPDWEFLFFGANQDAFSEGGGMGIRGGTTTNFAGTPQSVRASYANTASFISSTRQGNDTTEYNLAREQQQWEKKEKEKEKNK